MPEKPLIGFEEFCSLQISDSSPKFRALSPSAQIDTSMKPLSPDQRVLRLKDEGPFESACRVNDACHIHLNLCCRWFPTTRSYCCCHSPLCSRHFWHFACLFFLPPVTARVLETFEAAFVCGYPPPPTRPPSTATFTFNRQSACEMSLPEPSTSHLVSAPNEVVIKILKNLDQQDVRNASATCSRMQEVVMSHMTQLTRSSIYDLTLQCKEEPEEPVQLGKFRFPLKKQITKTKHALLLRNKKKKQWIRQNSAISPEAGVSGMLDETLRKFVINGALNFDRYTVDEKLYDRLMENFVNFKNAKLNFTLCKLLISSSQLINLFKHSSGRSLSIEFCENVDKLLSDELFLSSDSLENVNIQLRNLHTRLDLTDRVLEHWAGQEHLPTRIYLNETKTCFTIGGVIKLIKTFLSRSAQRVIPPTQTFSWDLGNILMGSDIRELFIPNVSSKWTAFEDGNVHFNLSVDRNCKVTFSTYLFATL
ncbi:hypothetical protein L596_022705 [Steinernema carpocapsae]|uniref:F-box domain-containing protein n=1 Tax=Steinernema carpocapsae TaxID=34508 RepID=A0A4U5MMJ2_STECR|nr:hypothetical protein L596_022705 [Steinernema carpocapsae]